MWIISAVEHHLLVVAEDRDQLATTTQIDQEIENFSTVRASVDVISQRDDGVVRSGDDGFQKGFQRRCVSVDVADSDQSSCS